MAKAVKCKCTHKACEAWYVEPNLTVNDVTLDEDKARLVADLLNCMDGEITLSELEDRLIYWFDFGHYDPEKKNESMRQEKGREA